MDVQRLVGGQGPGRGGPDDGEAVPLHWNVEGFRELLLFCERKTDIDGRIPAVLVLDLSFGERRAAVEAPVDRLESSVNVALLEQPAEDADLVGFVAVRHREVRVVPVAQDTEALEVLPLALD